MIENLDPNSPEAIEIQEWRESLRDVLKLSGPEQVQQILDELDTEAHISGVDKHFKLNTPYTNSISEKEESPYPGSREIERRIKSIIRWNAMAMVTQANQKLDGIGGHISTFASAATLYDVGFNHFWRAPSDEHPGDLIYYQGHASPGMYSRAYVEGRLDEEKLTNFRRELAEGGGLSSYPHPWLMPDFWQFPTVSMGLGPQFAIYHARFIKYLENRGLKQKSDQKVWAFLGDGECDEPESLAPISIAGREELDNLVFVINCNLQRLDGPVRGNSSIVQELERRFLANGWNVVKVLWSSDWDSLFDADTEGALEDLLNNTVDGEFQKLSTAPGAYVREHFFGRDPRVLKMVEHLSDDEIQRLRRGGHDPQKIYSAYKNAVDTKGQPTVILAKTVKGYGLGEAGEGKNISHNQKKLNQDEMYEFRSRFGIPISDDDIKENPFFRPAEDSKEMKYLSERRKALGGHLPQRRPKASQPILPPDEKAFEEFYGGSGDKEVSSTFMYVRLIGKLLRDKNIGKLIVPIVPDESRTFGMEGLFAQVGIYAHDGQKYEPIDRKVLSYYKESKDGQILQEGINESGAMSSFIAAGTAYSNHDINMIPFYVYYSMFGFQRVGDHAWAAGDSRCRGFLIGGTAGRTTLNGEGLQHEDGHSHLVAATIPNCIAYDPAYGFELAVIIKEGIKRMYVEQNDVFYYVTAMNENYLHPAMPEGVEEGILKGIYKLYPAKEDKAQVNLMGSGSILNEVAAAQKILDEKYGIDAAVYSVTSYPELKRNAEDCVRHNLLNPDADEKVPYISQVFAGQEDAVFITSSDYVKNLASSLTDHIPGPYMALGTDGFGRSESRPNLRDFFEVDRRYVTLAALYQLAKKGSIEKSVVSQAIKDLEIDPNKLNPMYS